MVTAILVIIRVRCSLQMDTGT